MDIPTISIVNSPISDANRLLHSLVQVANGFYREKKYAVLPYKVDGNIATIYLPDLDYSSIANGWNKWSQIHDIIPFTYPDAWVFEILDLETFASAREISYRSEEFEFSHFAPIWEALVESLPILRSKITTIEVRISSFGSNMSYQTLDEIQNNTLVIYLRNDAKIGSLCKGIIFSAVRSDPTLHVQRWESIASVVDYLMDMLVKKGLLTSYTPTISSLDSLSSELLADSLHYQQRIGAFSGQSRLVLTNGTIYFAHSSVSQLLTGHQNLLLTALLKAEGAVVPYDALASLLFTSDDKFSLWALNKMMSRLKARILTLNLPIQIKNLKGRGYILHHTSEY